MNAIIPTDIIYEILSFSSLDTIEKCSEFIKVNILRKTCGRIQRCELMRLVSHMYFCSNKFTVVLTSRPPDLVKKQFKLFNRLFARNIKIKSLPKSMTRSIRLKCDFDSFRDDLENVKLVCVDRLERWVLRCSRRSGEEFTLVMKYNGQWQTEPKFYGGGKNVTIVDKMNCIVSWSHTPAQPLIAYIVYLNKYLNE